VCVCVYMRLIMTCRFTYSNPSSNAVVSALLECLITSSAVLIFLLLHARITLFWNIRQHSIAYGLFSVFFQVE
jgi:hypothetical protein